MSCKVKYSAFAIALLLMTDPCYAQHLSHEEHAKNFTLRVHNASLIWKMAIGKYSLIRYQQ